MGMQTFSYVKFVERNNVNTIFLSRFIINHPNTYGLIKSGSVVLAGGAIRRLVECSKTESDYDLFILGNTSSNYVEHTLLLDGFKKQRTTEHHNEYVHENYGTKVQVITMQSYKNIAELFEFFDFTICQCAFDGISLHFGDYTLFDIARKRLAINKITFFHSSLRRMLKYGNQGYYACSGTLQTYINAVAEASKDALNQEIKYVD